MKTRSPRRGVVLACVLAGCCTTVAIFAACGSSEGSTFVGGGGTNDGGTSGTSGNSGQLGPIVGGDGSDLDVANGVHVFVDPATTTVTVTNAGSPPKTTFTAKDQDGKPITVSWTLDDYTLGTIDASGVFTPKGTIGGTVKVIATVVTGSGVATGTATITVTIALKSDLGDVTLPDGRVVTQDATKISAANRTALDGAPIDEGAGGTTLSYPYDKTVMPRGLLAPVPQFTGGTHPPEDFKVSLDTNNFHWEGYGHVAGPLESALPQDVWDGAFLSATPDATTGERIVTLSVVKASGGKAYGPASTHLVVAPASLTGVVYYSSYSQNQIMNDAGGGGTDFGLWSVRPGSTQAPNHLNSGCVICHSVSANGKTLTTGADQGGPGSGVYATDGTNATQLAKAPDGLVGDSRGLSWTAISPDGQYVMRSKKDFWGGDLPLAWKTPTTPDAGMPLSETVPVTNGVKMFVPSWSPDGSKLVFINADAAIGPTRYSVGIVDIAIGTTGIAFSNPRKIFDGSPDKHNTRVPTFLPDSHDIVLQETVVTNEDDNTQYGEKVYQGQLPNWTGGEESYTPGALYALRQKPDGTYAHVEMKNANTGSKPAYATVNYEPKPLPVQVGGYYWVVFTSTRLDGIDDTTKAGLGKPQLKKLWITAISPGADPTADPSHPPFLITNQSIIPTQRCERAYWTVEPCHADGTSCATGDDCCNGFCRPEKDGDPTSKFVCKKPTTITCASDGDRCRAGHSEECCGTAQGSQCIGSLNGFGTCAAPAVH